MGRTIDRIKELAKQPINYVVEKALTPIVEKRYRPLIEAVCDTVIVPILEDPMIQDILGIKKPVKKADYF
jgi:hypothetical protein